MRTSCFFLPLFEKIHSIFPTTNLSDRNHLLQTLQCPIFIYKQLYTSQNIRIGRELILKHTNGLFYINHTDRAAIGYQFQSITFSGSQFQRKTKIKKKMKYHGRLKNTIFGVWSGLNSHGVLGSLVGGYVGYKHTNPHQIKIKTKDKIKEYPGKGKIYLKNTQSNATLVIPFKATDTEYKQINRFFEQNRLEKK